MRLWSIHPKYLDAKGLVALWREGLLAQKVLQGKTRGYKHHPQLARFRKSADPEKAMASFLSRVLEEASRRHYSFDETKIARFQNAGRSKLKVSQGQLEYEFTHLKRKLRVRDPARFRELKGILGIEPHPLFRVVSGPIESWERLTPAKI